EGSRGPLGSGPLHPEVRRRVSLAVRAGEAGGDPADAPAAVELARLAQRRIQDRALPNALRISGGMVLVWLILVAVPWTISPRLLPGGRPPRPARPPKPSSATPASSSRAARDLVRRRAPRPRRRRAGAGV